MRRMSDLHDPGERRLRVLLALAAVVIAVGGTVDLVLDRPTTFWSFHVIFEVLTICAALVMVVLFGAGWLRAERSASTLRSELDRQLVEREVWQERAGHLIAGLTEAIDDQFVAWELTDAERDVARRLLRGHSHKHIARATDRSERTVRQHAASVYRKAGLSGRAELSAFFLDGLLHPVPNGRVVTP